MARSIDLAECIGCGACESACPQEAVSQSETFPVTYRVDPLLCNDCERCESLCPVDGFTIADGWAICHARGLSSLFAPLRGGRVLGGPVQLSDLRISALASTRRRVVMCGVRGDESGPTVGGLSEDPSRCPRGRSRALSEVPAPASGFGD